jgi:hypothetical protein
MRKGFAIMAIVLDRLSRFNTPQPFALAIKIFTLAARHEDFHQKARSICCRKLDMDSQFLYRVGLL